MSQETTKNNLHSSKSILVIDTPESCDECPLRSYSNLELVCTPMRKGASDVECPLKPMPERKPTDFLNYWFNQGYNALHDELVGDEDE